MRELDYPIMSPQEILRQPEYARRTADGTLWDTLGGADTTPHQLADANAGLDVSPVASTVDDDGACSAVTPGAPGAHVTVEADELAVRIEAGDSPVDVRARSVARRLQPDPHVDAPPGDHPCAGRARATSWSGRRASARGCCACSPTRRSGCARSVETGLRHVESRAMHATGIRPRAGR